MKSISFNSHHGTWGSYFSFVLGKLNHHGGFVLNDVKPPYTNLYIGYKKGNDKPKLFPFFSKKKMNKGEEKYLFNNINILNLKWYKKNTLTFKKSKIERTIKWATESWTAESITMTIITPFDKIPDPVKMNKETAKFYFCPAIFIQLEFDNTNGTDDMTGIFALQDMRRLISDESEGKILGVANGTRYGFAAIADKDIKENLANNIVKDSFEKDKNNFRLANEGGLTFKVPQGKKKKFTLALGAYIDNVVTTGIKTKFYYTQFFTGLEDVLHYALLNFNKYYKVAASKDKELESSGLNDYKKIMIAHFTRSYIANTELILDEKKNPLFVVNEGEYQMMNTLDLTVDQVFWEMIFSPWTIKNELESFLLHHQYQDSIIYDNKKVKNGEIGFCHDQGVANMFSPDGYSSYETDGRDIFFSYMTFEEILNWLLTAGIYGLVEGNTDWLKKHYNVFVKILNSIIVRDENNDGVMDKDSSRCKNGSEITTYDSLDISLGQARNNLYLAVKTWAGYICLEKIFQKLKKDAFIKKAKERSVLCAATILSKYDAKLGYIPAVFEKNNKSKIIPAIEGLIYPYILGDLDAVSINGRFSDFIKTLSMHFNKVLAKGSCINLISGGWQLSSTSKNTWMSKIIINQFVAEKILNFKTNKWEKWDKIHLSWQQKGCSFYAATDQINCYTGEDLGSRLYPRLVTAILWMKF